VSETSTERPGVRALAGGGQCSAGAATPSVDRLKANIGLLLTICAWGGFFPLLERLLQSWDVYSATLARQACGMLVLLPFALAGRKQAPLPRLVAWRRILLLGLVGVAFGSFLTSIGVRYSSGLSSAIISTTNPVTAALTAAALYREPLGRAIVFGTILSVLGGLVSVLGGDAIGHARFQGGEILIVVANVAWTWMSIAAQRWLSGYSQLQIAAFTVAAGAFWLVLLLPVLVVSGLLRLHIDLSVESLAIVLYAGIFPNALGNFFWHYAVNRIGVVTASMYNNLLPLAAVGATLLLGGSFTWPQIAGSLVILLGVALAQSPALRGKKAER
jgi:drug/metabolite transporter (DMT)-like permease